MSSTVSLTVSRSGRRRHLPKEKQAMLDNVIEQFRHGKTVEQIFNIQPRGSRDHTWEDPLEIKPQTSTRHSKQHKPAPHQGLHKLFEYVLNDSLLSEDDVVLDKLTEWVERQGGSRQSEWLGMIERRRGTANTAPSPATTATLSVSSSSSHLRTSPLTTQVDEQDEKLQQPSEEELDRIEKDFVRMENETKRLRTVLMLATKGSTTLERDTSSSSSSTTATNGSHHSVSKLLCPPYLISCTTTKPETKVDHLKEAWGKLDIVLSNTQRAMTEFTRVFLNEQYRNLVGSREKLIRLVEPLKKDRSMPCVEAMANELAAGSESPLADQLERFREESHAVVSSFVSRYNAGDDPTFFQEKETWRKLADVLEYLAPLDAAYHLRPKRPSSWLEIVKTNYEQGSICIKVYELLLLREAEDATETMGLFSTVDIGRKYVAAMNKAKSELADEDEAQTTSVST